METVLLVGAIVTEAIGFDHNVPFLTLLGDRCLSVDLGQDYLLTPQVEIRHHPFHVILIKNCLLTYAVQLILGKQHRDNLIREILILVLFSNFLYQFQTVPFCLSGHVLEL